MRCEKCQAHINFDSTVCPECGALVLAGVEGFENTKEVAKRLKSIVDEYGADIVKDDIKLVALINDFIPEFDKELRLLRNMLDGGILKILIENESNHEFAITNAKGQMLGRSFLSESAAEFVIVCFTYMLGWEYLSPLREKDPEQIAKEKQEAEEAKKKIAIPPKPFTKSDALRFRISGSVNIAEGFTKLEDMCFDGYSFMKMVTLPSTLVTIGEYAFSECKRLKKVELPPSLRVIKQGAFSQCNKLSSINIPHGVIEIEDSTFAFCESLESIEIPVTVGSIGISAFWACESLKRLFLPDSIKFIDKDAFKGCDNLTIRCYENSYVHKYCINNDINCEPLQEGVEITTKLTDNE